MHLQVFFSNTSIISIEWLNYETNDSLYINTVEPQSFDMILLCRNSHTSVTSWWCHRFSYIAFLCSRLFGASLLFLKLFNEKKKQDCLKKSESLTATCETSADYLNTKTSTVIAKSCKKVRKLIVKIRKWKLRCLILLDYLFAEIHGN